MRCEIFDDAADCVSKSARDVGVEGDGWILMFVVVFGGGKEQWSEREEAEKP